MQVVAIDCEMVKSRSGELLARVSIVDHEGNVLLDEYVQPTDVVTDYKTAITGFTKERLDRGKPFSQVRSTVSKLLEDLNCKLLVGHSLHNDLGVLHLDVHPKLWDLAKHREFMKNDQPQSLKDLAKKYLNKTIQTGVHDSVTDAQTAMELYIVATK